MIEYHSLRTPRGDGSTLVAPSVSTWPDVLAENRRRLEAIYRSSRGGWLSNIATTARRELIAVCERDMAEYLPPSGLSALKPAPPSDGQRPSILLSGHQPQWFHPGVWFKNALSAKHAGAVGCIPVHFALDSDTLGRAEVHAFAGDPEHPSLVTVPYDQPSAEMAIEDRGPVDFKTIDSFAERLARTIAPFAVGRTLMQQWSGRFSDRVRATHRVGWAIAQTRHAIEVANGWTNLETRMSSICGQPSFARFVGWLCEWADPLASYHNRALADYRAVHGIRSHSHPFPDLAATENETELPLWIWSRQNPRRKRLFLRRDGQQRSLTDREGTTILLPRHPADEVDWWFAASASEIRIRPRALCTTLYSRLVLSDLFIHGIGGAKYDQVTDEIVRQWLGCEPPQFVTATATVWLPIRRPKESHVDVLEAEQLLRRMRYNPEVSVAGLDDSIDPKLREAILRKQSLVASRPESGSRQAWHESIVSANEAIRELAQDQLKSRAGACHQTIDQGHLGETLRNRELPFCLYPQDKFPRALLDLTVE